jgi:hypothetical protein
VQKLDCGVYDERGKSLTVGLNFSLLWGGATGGPSVQRAQTAGVKWDKSVQFIIAQYKELCGRYNSGGISQASYDRRLGEIDQLYAEAAGIRQSADDIIRRHSQGAFSALDRQTAGEAETGGQGAEAEQVASAVDALTAKVGFPP